MRTSFAAVLLIPFHQPHDKNLCFGCRRYNGAPWLDASGQATITAIQEAEFDTFIRFRVILPVVPPMSGMDAEFEVMPRVATNDGHQKQGRR